MVECDAKASRQHELNVAAAIEQFLGTPANVPKVPEFESVLLGAEGNPATESNGLSRYDSRRMKPNRSAEWRLY